MTTQNTTAMKVVIAVFALTMCMLSSSAASSQIIRPDCQINFGLIPSKFSACTSNQDVLCEGHTICFEPNGQRRAHPCMQTGPGAYDSNAMARLALCTSRVPKGYMRDGLECNTTHDMNEFFRCFKSYLDANGF